MIRSTIAISLAFALSMTSAMAECFEDVGCTNSQKFRLSSVSRLNCGNLWFLRNSIYDDNGYCFKTEQGISAFGNDVCRYNDMNSVPLNSYERYNIAIIRKAELAKGC